MRADHALPAEMKMAAEYLHERRIIGIDQIKKLPGIFIRPVLGIITP